MGDISKYISKRGRTQRVDTKTVSSNKNKAGSSIIKKENCNKTISN